MKKVFLFAVSAMIMAACNCSQGNSGRCSDDACRGTSGENCREECVESRNCNDGCDADCADSCLDAGRNHRSDCIRHEECRTSDDNCSEGRQRCRDHHSCRTEHCR